MAHRLLSPSLILLASLLPACDSGTSDPGPAPAANGAQAPAEPGTVTPATPPATQPGTPATPTAPSGDGAAVKPAPAKPAANKFVAPTRAELAEHKQSLTAHLNAGRAAVKAKDYTTGIAELEKAAAINPMHGKTLGELGWAYFNAGQLDEAEDRLERGLHHADNDGTRGAILYNLGRVAEAKSDTTRAIELYTRSLAVRPNETVEARLTGLGGTVPTVGGSGAMVATTHSECGFDRVGAPDRNLCLAYVAGLEQPADPDDDSYQCAYGRTAMTAEGETAPAGGMPGNATDATVYDLKIGETIKAAVFSYNDFSLNDETVILAVVIDGVLYTSQLTWVSHPGVGYSDENLDTLEIRAEDVVPGGKPEIVIEWRVLGHDMDPGDEMEAIWSSKHVAVVSVDGGQPRWLAALTREQESSYGPMEDWPGEEIAEPSNEPTETKRSAVTAAWTGGQLTVSASGEASAPVGSYAIADYPQRCPAELL